MTRQGSLLNACNLNDQVQAQATSLTSTSPNNLLVLQITLVSQEVFAIANPDNITNFSQ
jgi:hypothetical protein